MNNQTLVEQLEIARQTLLTKANHLKEAIDVLQSENLMQSASTDLTNAVVHSPKDDPQPSNLKARVITLFKRENRFLHVREINQLILESDSDLAKDERIIDKIRSHISNLKTQGAIVPFRVGSSNQNTFWGSKKWLDSEGKPKPEHMYREEALISQVTNNVIDI